MKANIEIFHENYGGFMVHNWQLVLTKGKLEKKFFLGQDAKFCSRVLGMSTSEVVDAIGSSDLYKDEVKIKLANFIVKHLELTEEAFNLQSWELSCQ
jgi:hypothetical protein